MQASQNDEVGICQGASFQGIHPGNPEVRAKIKSLDNCFMTEIGLASAYRAFPGFYVGICGHEGN